MSETLQDETFTILTTAVTLAKDEQIRSVEYLRKRLQALYPGKESEIDAAIDLWAHHVKAAGLAALPR